ncbi:hypothetical protein ACJX0J_012603 [Zea mays]
MKWLYSYINLALHLLFIVILPKLFGQSFNCIYHIYMLHICGYYLLLVTFDLWHLVLSIQRFYYSGVFYILGHEFFFKSLFYVNTINQRKINLVGMHDPHETTMDIYNTKPLSNSLK